MRPNKLATHLAWLIGLLAIGLRFIAITQPFIDNWSWRESDVATIARNFSENGFHFAWPQIDWAGDAAGYVGTEFPILPFVAAIAYEVFGAREWIGRLETVLFFAASLPFFYLLVGRIFGETTALWSLVFYSFAPLHIAASRAFMPDVPSLSLALAGVYFFLRWLENDEWKWLLSAGISIAFALLIKITTVLVGASLLYLFIAAVSDRRTVVGESSDGHRPPLQKHKILGYPKLWLFAAIALLPSTIWYLHAYRIAQNYYPYHFFGGGGFQIEHPAWYWKIASRTVVSSLTPILSLLALVGMFVANGGKYRRVFHWWLLAMIVFVFVVGWGNRHAWYQLPFIPIAAAFTGCACKFIADKFVIRRAGRVILSLALVVTYGAWSYASAHCFYKPTASALQSLGLKLKAITPPNALIIVADGGDPTVFYYAHRKGWHFLEHGIYHGNPLNSEKAIANLEKLRRRGANYFVLYRGTLWWLDYYKEFAQQLARTSKLIARTSEYAIYKLDSSATTQ